MSQKSFNLATGIIFAIIAVSHLIRSILGFDVLVGGVSISIGVSVIAFLATTLLSYSAFRLNNKQ